VRRSRVSGSSPIRFKLDKQQLRDGRSSFKDKTTVDRFSFQGLEMSDGKPVKDLNDLLSSIGVRYRRNAKLIEV
jgi:hypothetical protein